MTSDRRRFSRIPFQTKARLCLPEGEFEVGVADVSLKGALVSPSADLFANIGSNGTLQIPLNANGEEISMDITLVHREANHLGLACRNIDLDSVTHLRRLVELNIGDESILHRELRTLVHQEQ